MNEKHPINHLLRSEWATGRGREDGKSLSRLCSAVRSLCHRSRGQCAPRACFQRCDITSSISESIDRHVCLYHVKFWTKYLFEERKVCMSWKALLRQTETERTFSIFSSWAQLEVTESALEWLALKGESRAPFPLSPWIFPELPQSVPNWNLSWFRGKVIMVSSIKRREHFHRLVWCKFQEWRERNSGSRITVVFKKKIKTHHFWEEGLNIWFPSGKLHCVFDLHL